MPADFNSPVYGYSFRGDVNDSFGGADGTPVNNPSYGTDHEGTANRAIVFSGSEYVTFPVGEHLPSGAWAIGLTILTNDTLSGHFAFQRSSNSASASFALEQGSRFTWRVGGNSVVSTAVSTATWYTVKLEYTGSFGRMIVIPVGNAHSNSWSNMPSGVIPNHANHFLTIGSNLNNTAFFDGKLARWYMWNDQLSDDDWASFHSGASPTNSAGGGGSSRRFHLYPGSALGLMGG